MIRKAHLAAGLCIGAIAAALGFLLVHFSFGNWLKFASYDLLFALRPVNQPSEALIIYMDEDAHSALNQSLTQPWDRNLHAQLLDRLTAAGAKAVVFDIHFSGEGPDRQATTNLARAIKANGRVVLGADIVRAGPATRRYLPPFELLDDAAAEVGSVELDVHADVTARKHLETKSDDLLPTLSWAAAKAAGHAIGELGDPGLERWINYYGPPGTIPHLGYDGALTAAVNVFSNKVVYIGARLFTKLAGERKDEFRSPYSLWLKRDLFHSGVEIQATQYLNLARHDWLLRLRPSSEGWLVILAGLIAGLGLIVVRPWVAAALAIVSAVAILALVYFVFWNWNIWFPWLIPVAAQLPAALALAVVYNAFRLYLDNKLLEQSLSRHLSPVRARQLLRQRDLLQPGAEKQILTIMFTDIANFTKLSEGMDSDALAKLMNNYFEEAISCVYETDGFLVKLIGDALFAIWNAPIEQADHTARALKSALLLQERVANFRGPNGIILQTRIGIHMGSADVGNFGSTKRFDYTAIGENVNLASRLEGLNKHLGTHVLVSREVQIAVADQFPFRSVGRFRLKGFEKSLEVYEPLVELAEWHPLFAEAVQQFAAANLDAAETSFRSVLKLHPGDGPSQFYLTHLQTVRAIPLPANWSGEIEIHEK